MSLLNWSTCVWLVCALSSAAADRAVIPWSFRPLQRPALPKQADIWINDDLDRFILAGLTSRQLRPVADAPRATLLRRATLDLHGLLPTPEEVVAFEHDPAPDAQAFATVVDRLLQSPRFGERWARHWLDLVRYADSVGRSWNAPFTHAFRYRDWVIDSLNADKPYTRFMAEQIAGDLLPARTEAEKQQNLTGTGFLTLGCMDLTLGEAETFRMEQIDDQIDVTTRAFLGLTVACARCHDHKTDPITQHDYYALAGLFYSTETWSGTADRSHLGRNLYVDPDRLLSLPASKALVPASKNAAAAPAMMTEEVEDTGRRKRGPQRHAYDASLVMGVSEDKPRNCPIRIAGNAYEEGRIPQRGDLKIPALPSLPRISGTESGRYQLAQWLSQPTHPLTARVAANRIWAHLFGKGIVSTTDNFGITGARPVAPELLDHLAIRFVETGWSTKKFIRALMLSHTYRLASDADAHAMEVDPGNDLHWRMTPRRLELEALRDSLLQLSGGLTFDRPTGIQVAGTGGKGNTGRTSSLLEIGAPFRTIYLPVLRDLLPEMHETWDFPNPTQIKGQRDVTTVPSQALFMMNNRMVVGAARAVARQLVENNNLKEDESRVREAMRLIYGRAADAEETASALQMMRSLTSASPEDRLTILVQAMIGGAEFRYAL